MALHIECRFNKKSLLQCYFLATFFLVSIIGGKKVDEENFKEEISFDIATDIYDYNHPNFPKNFKEVIKMLEDFPKLLESTNDGKGVPVEYTLLPYTVLKEFIKNKSDVGTRLVSIKEEIIEQCLKKMEHAKTCLLYTSPSPRDS